MQQVSGVSFYINYIIIHTQINVELMFCMRNVFIQVCLLYTTATPLIYLYTVLSDVETNQWKITTLRQMAQKLGSKHLVHLASKMGMLYFT